MGQQIIQLKWNSVNKLVKSTVNWFTFKNITFKIQS